MEALANTIYINFLPLFLTLIALYIFQIIIFTWASKLIPHYIFRIYVLPGVFLHELSHIFFCILSFHKIVEVSFFNTNGSDAMGYVTHSYNPDNLYQRVGNVFIGIAPAFAGVWVLFILFNYYDLLPEQKSLDFYSYYQHIIYKLIDMPILDTFICVYLTSSIAATMSPSKADYKGAIGGIIISLILFFTANIFFSSFISVTFLNIYELLTLFSSYAIQSLVISTLFSFVLFIPAFLFRYVTKKQSVT
jgi:hypothetical protein